MKDKDAEIILSDQDQTISSRNLKSNQNAKKNIASSSVVDSSDDFIRGEVDVKTQMDRAARAAELSRERTHLKDDMPTEEEIRALKGEI